MSWSGVESGLVSPMWRWWCERSQASTCSPGGSGRAGPPLAGMAGRAREGQGGPGRAREGQVGASQEQPGLSSQSQAPPPSRPARDQPAVPTTERN